MSNLPDASDSPSTHVLRTALLIELIFKTKTSSASRTILISALIESCIAVDQLIVANALADTIEAGRKVHIPDTTLINTTLKKLLEASLEAELHWTTRAECILDALDPIPNAPATPRGTLQ